MQPELKGRELCLGAHLWDTFPLASYAPPVLQGHLPRKVSGLLGEYRVTTGQAWAPWGQIRLRPAY